MRIGAHVSTAGGVSKAFERGAKLGADCLQIFAGSPRMWRPPKLESPEVDRFRQLRQETGIQPVFIHTIYLLNFASADPTLIEKSVESLALTLRVAELLGVEGVITHLGSDRATGEDGEASVVIALGEALELAPGRSALLLETAAGSTMGRSFAQLGRLIAKLDGHPRLKVCLDTAHVFAAGYDFRTADGLSRMLDEFDRDIGLSRLMAIHANDSKRPLGSGLDRHENIGEGHIGEEGFALLLRHAELRELPFLLEVPGYDGRGPDERNLATLRRLAGIGGVVETEIGDET